MNDTARSGWKVTLHDGQETVTVRLEGRITGAWATEFKRTWEQSVPSLDGKRILFDLDGVTHMDREAKEMLAEIHRATGAEFLANTPLTKYFAEEARRRNAKS